jgi:hypothetical protein
MTQQAEQKKHEIDWLVSAPEGTNAPSFMSLLASACRGNTDIASVLNYFLYAAALQAKKDSIDKTTIQSIVVRCSLDDITTGILRVNRGTRKPFCKKTLIKYIAKLQSWEIIQSNGYKRLYEVNITKVNDLIKNPPEAEKPKPRGKAAHTSTDCKNTISHKNIIPTERGGEELDSLREKVVSLQSEIVSLQSQIVSLQSIVVSLQSVQSSEAASREALEAKVDALYKVIYNNSNNSNIKTEKNKRVTTPTRSRSKTSTVQQELPQETGPDLSHLSEQELAVYNLLSAKHKPWYLQFNENGRHNYGVWLQKYKKQTYVPLGDATVDTLNTLPMFTLEELQETEKLAYELDGKYIGDHGGFQIHNLATWLNKRQLLHDRPQSNTKRSSGSDPHQSQNEQSTPEDGDKMVAWTKAGKYEGDPEKNWQQFELMKMSEALKYGWHKGIFPGVTHNKIMIQLRKQQAAQEKHRVSA